MKIEVELISEELIKPSSPTPHHLRRYNFSFLDQIHVPFFIPFLLFYPKTSSINNIEIYNQLKQSLSQVLTIFYPLAGRINNTSCVNCNDEGFLFVEANANCQLSFVLRDRNPYNYKKFSPVNPEDTSDLAAFCQITFFSCGGLVITFGISHKLGDAFSHFMFLNSWASIARGNTDISIPFFGSATLFPPRNISGYEPTEIVNPKEKIITKVFVFDASSIEALVAKYTINGERLSRIEALTAFIWSRFMATTQTAKAKNKLYKVNVAVNLRSRMKLPLRKLSFGNLVWSAAAKADVEAKDDYSYGIVKRMKDSIKNINADTVKKLQNSDEQLNFLENLVENSSKDVVSLNFSSICSFPTYESNFGWGKPLWIATTPFPGMNIVGFMDSREGKGIEAWISLLEEDMSKFEIDNQLLAHVSSASNGNPLHAQSRL